jgi:hypothetical protein
MARREWVAKDGAVKLLRGRLKDDDGEWIDLDTWGTVTAIITRHGQAAQLLGGTMTKLDQTTSPGSVTYELDLTTGSPGRGTYDVEIEAVNPAGDIEKFPCIKGVPFGTLEIEPSKDA